MTPLHEQRFDSDDDPDVTQSGDPPSQDDAERERRLMAAVREYAAALEAGQRPNRRELLSKNPDIADELSACLGGLAFVQSAAAQMNGPGAPGGNFDEPESLLGEPLGDFRLIREIGRGGMGVVYEAVQLSLGRRVAVKVLPLASALDARHLQRFRNEAQAAAQLHHTGIVPVYAVGCERSVHFYAMQLIEGESLADAIRELRKLAGRAAISDDDTGKPAASGMRIAAGADSTVEGSRLRPVPLADASDSAQSLSSLRSSKGAAYARAVARLGLQAAEALDYAHRAGVVHRDIKPANLMLDALGNLWITDFGLAQFYTETGLTRSGDLLGTLRYMSPEQASGRAVVLDERTDVYSLGVTLYELLTLERALPGETREQLLGQLGSHDPRPPRSIDKTIPPELETIITKAMAKEPADRYVSARALAEDLKRYLGDKPILARPPSVREKAVKWTRRHKSLALSAVLLLMLATIGFLISTLLIAREQAKTRAAYVSERDKATEADQQRAEAQKSFGQARDAVNYLSRVAADELADSPGAAAVRKEMLEAALDYYQGFLEARQADASIGTELTEAQGYVSKILAELAAFESFDLAQARARLLDEPAIRTELGLSPVQIDRVDSLDPDSGGDAGPGGMNGLRGLRSLTSEQKQQRFAASAAKIENALNGILTPVQADRLRQIARQLRGPVAFSDPDVAAALALTREQRDALRRIQADFRIAMRKGLDRLGPPDRRHDRPPQADVAALARQKEAIRQVLGLFTPTQVRTWQVLTGTPFLEKVINAYDPFRRGPEGPPRDGRSPDGPPPDDGRGPSPGRRPGPRDGPRRHGPGADGPDRGPGHDEGPPSPDGPEDGPDHRGPPRGGPAGPDFPREP